MSHTEKLDTSAEAVEAMVAQCGNMPNPEEAAAILRALLHERDEAKREYTEMRAWRDEYSHRLAEVASIIGSHFDEHDMREKLKAQVAVLDTARADALREALKIAQDAIPTARPPQTDHYGAHVAGERAAAERIVQRLNALIQKEPRA